MKQQNPYEPKAAHMKELLDGLGRCHAPESRYEFLRVWIRDWAQSNFTIKDAKFPDAVEHYGGVFDEHAVQSLSPKQQSLDGLDTLARERVSAKEGTDAEVNITMQECALEVTESSILNQQRGVR